MSQEPEESESQIETLPQSIRTESNKRRDFEIIGTGAPPSLLTDTAAALESQLESLKLERKQERFVWIFVVTGIINAVVSSTAPAVGAGEFLLFSLIFLVVCAKWLEMPSFAPYLDRWINKVIPPIDESRSR
jgi:hypothetical protein